MPTTTDSTHPRYGRLQTAILNHLFWKIQAAEWLPHQAGSVVTADTFELAWGAYDCSFERQPTESQLRSTRRALLRLRDDGAVQPQSRGNYTLTDGGIKTAMETTIGTQRTHPNELQSLLDTNTPTAHPEPESRNPSHGPGYRTTRGMRIFGSAMVRRLHGARLLRRALPATGA
jgi:hypothetical protein